MIPQFADGSSLTVASSPTQSGVFIIAKSLNTYQGDLKVPVQAAYHGRHGLCPVAGPSGRLLRC